MRNELKAPPVSYPGLSSSGSMDRGGPSSQQGYPSAASMYGSSGGYDPSGYGMGAPSAMSAYGYADFSGYGMGMGGYGMPESAGSMPYGPPMDGQGGAYGAPGSAGSYSMGGMMGGAYQGGMMGYDQYGQPMDGSAPPGAPPGPYSPYGPQGSWGQG